MSNVLWVAHYHDPYPGHLYPEPYRSSWSVPGWHRERHHDRVLRAACALSFPGRRLRDWILAGDRAVHRNKAFVLPHLMPEASLIQEAMKDSCPEENRRFTLVHTGTINRHRAPWGLFQALERFVSELSPEQRNVRVVFTGLVHQAIRDDERWRRAEHDGWLEVVEERLPYSTALKLAAGASANIILEAEAEESPFYPGKLADYLAVARPILALTPGSSTVRDILGTDYDLLCRPNDVDAICRSLKLIFRCWAAGNAERLAPSERARSHASEETALRELRRLESFITNGCSE